LCGPCLALYGLSPPKLTPEGIELETFGGANSKIPSQPLGQLQMGLKKNKKLIKEEKLFGMIFGLEW